MSMADEQSQDPQVVQREVRNTQARLAKSVEAVAFHKAHIKDEVKDALKGKVTRTGDHLKKTVSVKAGKFKRAVCARTKDLRASFGGGGGNASTTKAGHAQGAGDNDAEVRRGSPATTDADIALLKATTEKLRRDAVQRGGATQMPG